MSKKDEAKHRSIHAGGVQAGGCEARGLSTDSRSDSGRLSNKTLPLHIRIIHAEVEGEYGWPRVWTCRKPRKPQSVAEVFRPHLG